MCVWESCCCCRESLRITVSLTLVPNQPMPGWCGCQGSAVCSPPPKPGNADKEPKSRRAVAYSWRFGWGVKLFICFFKSVRKWSSDSVHLFFRVCEKDENTQRINRHLLHNWVEVYLPAESVLGACPDKAQPLPRHDSAMLLLSGRRRNRPVRRVSADHRWTCRRSVLRRLESSG